MIYIQAPFSLPQTTMKLPSPLFDDGDALDHLLQMKRAMNGVRRSYVKTNGERLLTYDFVLTRGKGLELQAFIDAYYGVECGMYNWRDEHWKFKFMDPTPKFVYTTLGETTTVSLTLRGKQLG